MCAARRPYSDLIPESLEIAQELASMNPERKASIHRLEELDKPELRYLSGSTVTIATARGEARRSVLGVLGSSMVSAIRDFCDTDADREAACQAVKDVVRLGRHSRYWRRTIRRAIRCTFDDSRWQTEPTQAGTWRCPYCDERLSDEGGWPRRQHLVDEHPGFILVRSDVGTPSDWNYRFAHDHLLRTLAGVVREQSWSRYDRFFEGTDTRVRMNAHFQDRGAGELPIDNWCRVP